MNATYLHPCSSSKDNYNMIEKQEKYILDTTFELLFPW